MGENVLRGCSPGSPYYSRLLVFSVYMYFAALKEEIVALNKQYTEEWEEQDAEGVASFYTCDAKSMGPGMDVIHGKKGIHLLP